MSDYPLDPLGRFSLQSIHKQKCWLCYGAVPFSEMEIDHIIPESLRKNPETLKRTLDDFGLPTEFDLNSLSNLLPAHSLCNKQKRAHIFRATPIIQYWLDRASCKAQRVRDERIRLMKDRELEKAIAIIETNIDDLTEEQIERVAMPYAAANSSPVLVISAGDDKGGEAMSYMQPQHRYVPPPEFLVTSDTGVIFDQEPRESRDASFLYQIEHKGPKDE